MFTSYSRLLDRLLEKAPMWQWGPDPERLASLTWDLCLHYLIKRAIKENKPDIAAWLTEISDTACGDPE